MADEYLEIGKRGQAAVLRNVSEKLNRSPLVLEKDIWVCWALRTLFRMPDAPQMAFKGGTSLSKVFKVIDRFSEDVDITIDYRSLSPKFDPFDLAVSGAQRSRGCELLKDQVVSIVSEKIAPFFSRRLAKEALGGGAIELEQGGEAIRVSYESALPGLDSNSYMQSSILVEFGGRNTTQPMRKHLISPYVVGHTMDLFFPTAEIPVLAGERTFWEKATLIHVECNRSDFESRVERKSRHWYDLALLADHAIGATAISDLMLLRDVVQHKKVFFPSTQAQYEDCLSGGLKLIPNPKSLAALERDYQAMDAAGMFPSTPLPIADIIDRLSSLQEQVNLAMTREKGA